MKGRYRGLKKNAHRLFVTCALVNLFLSRKEVAAGSVVFVCSARRPRDGKGEAKQVRGFDSHIGSPVS